QGALVLSVLGWPGRAVEHLRRPQGGERAPGGTGLPREAVEGRRVSVLRRSSEAAAIASDEVCGESAHPTKGPTRQELPQGTRAGAASLSCFEFSTTPFSPGLSRYRFNR